MKVCLISIHFFPMKTSCAVLMTDLAREFATNGHEVTVITPTSDIMKKTSFNKHEDFSVFKFRSLKIVDINFIKRAINEFLLPLFFVLAYIKNPINKKHFDFIIWYSPSIFFSPIVWFLKRKSTSKTYLVLRDIFPEWTLDLGLMKQGLIYNFFKFCASFQYKIADTIGIQSKSNYKIIEKYTCEEKVEILNNWNSEALSNNTKLDINIDEFVNKKIIIYLGNMGIAQDMNFMIDVAENFYKKNYEEIFLFVGRGTEVVNLKEKVKNKKIENVKFFDEIPQENVHELLQNCTAGIIALDPRHTTHNIPGKFISYLQSSLPVIARINSDSDLEELIKVNNVGIAYNKNNVEEFALMTKKMIENNTELKLQQSNAHELYQKKFTTKSAYAQLIRNFEDV